MKIVWGFRPWERWTLAIFGLMFVVGSIIVMRCWNEAHDVPVVTRYDVPVEGLTQQVRIALLTDTHVNEDALASSVSLVRLRSIVSQTNQLSPDLVVLGGDYVATAGRKGDVTLKEAVAPFSRLRSRYGIVGVIGNHDCMEIENDAASISRDLAGAGVRPLVNSSLRAGPIQVVGLDDLWCGDSDIGSVGEAAVKAEGRPVVAVSHNPDVFPQMPSGVALTLAGHTHAAQIVPPVIGPIVSVSRFKHRYRYGEIVEGGRRLIVSAGLGGLPLRWNARPEIVLVTLRPAGVRRGS